LKTALIALVLSSGCYTLGAPRPPVERVAVVVADDDGIDVDLAAIVSTAVREAIAERTELALTQASEAQAVLYVDVVSGRSGLSLLADPALRSAEYKIDVILEGRLVRDPGELLWKSGPISGEATYLGSKGPIVHLDGDRRTAMSRAAQDASRRMISALLYAR